MEISNNYRQTHRDRLADTDILTKVTDKQT